MQRKEICFRNAFLIINYVLKGRIYYIKCFLDKLCKLTPPPPKKKKSKKKATQTKRNIDKQTDKTYIK